MKWFAKRQLGKGTWTLVGVMVLALIDGHATGQCQLDKFLAFDGEAGDVFGTSVSIGGTTGNEVAIVGAPQDDDNGFNAGAAYIFRFDPILGWVEEAKLLASDGAPLDNFGFSVSIRGDGGDKIAIVGAWGDDDNGTDSGSAYIYRFDAILGWVQEAKLLAFDGALDDRFGYSVSIGGEVAIVGAYRHDIIASPGPTLLTDTGAAYIYRFDAVSWIPEAKLLAFDGFLYDHFGVSVSIGGDAGSEIAIVGAYHDDDNGVDSGSAYIFRRSLPTWVQEAKISDRFGAAGDQFGYSVSMGGNSLAIIGANFDDDNGSNSGSAFIYSSNGATWVEQAFLLASDGATGDQFGYSVSINEGGVAVVGAIGDADNGLESGSAYFYSFNNVNWVEGQKLLASDGEASDQFGVSVSVGEVSAIVGANRHDDNGFFAGSAYLFFDGIFDCNSNGVNDCQDIIAGTSIDINGNALPDECESFAFNLTQGTNHATIPDAINAAFDGDRLHASVLALQVVENIDFSSKAITLTSAIGITVQVGEQFTLADNASLESAPGIAMLIRGDLLVPVGDHATLVASSLEIKTTSTMTLSASSILEIASSFGLEAEGRIDFFDATLSSPNGLTIAATGIISGFGVLYAPMTNNGNAIFIADTQVIGDYTNNNTTTIQNGTLAIIGTLVNNGTIIGDVAPAAAKAVGPSTGLFVNGNYSASTSASLLVPSADQFVRVGGDYDVAINDNNKFDMVLAELRMVGLGAVIQSLELMSEDIGVDSDGLDRSFPGHYPIGTLRIGPTPTTVTLVDNHDNDNLGQTQCEAIYVRNLIIDAGATLNTNGCRVYYETLLLDGVVDDPLNLIALPLCLADVNNDNSVNVTDLLSLLAAWGPCGAPCPPDINTDGIVNVTDLLALLAAWGACP